MKRTLRGMSRIFVLFLSFICLAQQASARQGFVNDSVKIGGNVRYFRMYLPDGLIDGAPLVFVLHGYSDPIGEARNWMTDASDRHKFALCVPDGLPDPKGKKSWNVGYPFQKGFNVDDVKTLCDMAEHVCKKYKLSEENTFATGCSNGGEMCYLLAYSDQTTFKALAPIAGLTLVWMYKELEAKRPIPLIEIHGTEDRTSEWTGDLDNKGGWGAYMPVPLAVGYFVAKARCTEEVTGRIPGRDSTNGHYTITHKFLNGNDGIEIWLYEVVGAPHGTLTDDINTGEEVWNFFSKYLTK